MRISEATSSGTNCGSMAARARRRFHNTRSRSWRAPMPKGAGRARMRRPVNSSESWTSNIPRSTGRFHPSNRLIGTFVRAEKKSPFFGASSTTPAPTTRVQSQPTRTWKVGSQNTLNNNLLIDSVVRILLLLDALLPAARHGRRRQPGFAGNHEQHDDRALGGDTRHGFRTVPGTIVGQLRDRRTPAEGRRRPQLGAAGFHASE